MNEYMQWFIDYYPSDKVFNDSFELTGYEYGYSILTNLFMVILLTLYLVYTAINYLSKWLLPRDSCFNWRIDAAIEAINELPNTRWRMILELTIDICVCSMIEILMR